jgi:hypothetical protein
MTRLAARRTKLTFETDSAIRNREIVVHPHPTVCGVRLKGTRTVFEISWHTIYVHAAAIAAEKLREERKAARKARRAGLR